MSYLMGLLPTDGQILKWFAPIGIWTRTVFVGLSPHSYKSIDWLAFKNLCIWLGPASLPLITFSAVLISLALSVETILETSRYNAQDISGAVIAIGLLRELGPLTVSLFWSARVAARLSDEARIYTTASNDDRFVADFVLPRYIAGLLMAVPLSAYGLAVGFLTAALYAPVQGVSSSADFLEIARSGIKDKDVITYFVKLILINPTLAVMVGSTYGRMATDSPGVTAANAITVMFIYAVCINLLFTSAMYLLS